MQSWLLFTSSSIQLAHSSNAMLCDCPKVPSAARTLIPAMLAAVRIGPYDLERLLSADYSMHLGMLISIQAGINILCKQRAQHACFQRGIVLCRHFLICLIQVLIFKNKKKIYGLLSSYHFTLGKVKTFVDLCLFNWFVLLKLVMCTWIHILGYYLFNVCVYVYIIMLYNRQRTHKNTATVTN